MLSTSNVRNLLRGEAPLRSRPEFQQTPAQFRRRQRNRSPRRSGRTQLPTREACLSDRNVFGFAQQTASLPTVATLSSPLPTMTTLRLLRIALLFLSVAV